MKKTKTKIKRIIFGSLILAWMIVIFCFSSEKSEKSSNTSQTAIKTGLSKVESFKQLEEQKQNEIIEKMQYPTRKLAHFTIYMIGGIIIFNFINTFTVSTKKKILITIVIGMIYASTDEVHQLFTDGRSGQITDVLIDTSGLIVGCGIANAVKHIKITISKKT